MRGNSHVRFGGAGRGNGPPERAVPRPGPTLLAVVAELLQAVGCAVGSGRGAVQFAFVLVACAVVCFNRL